MHLPRRRRPPDMTAAYTARRRRGRRPDGTAGTVPARTRPDTAGGI
jgi:hypothetical protein